MIGSGALGAVKWGAYKRLRVAELVLEPDSETEIEPEPESVGEPFSLNDNSCSAGPIRVAPNCHILKLWP